MMEIVGGYLLVVSILVVMDSDTKITTLIALLWPIFLMSDLIYEIVAWIKVLIDKGE